MNNHLPSGFQYLPNFINQHEEQFLLHQIKLLDWQEIKMHGVIAKRKVAHFGMNYLYHRRNAIPSNTPTPSFLNLYINRVADVMHLNPMMINQILISKYPIGAGIGWHTDAEVFKDKIFGISLLSPCTMKFRKLIDQRQVIKTEVAPRSGYILANAARFDWQHSIQAVKLERYSITFRSFQK